ncbi:MAG: hypothetical protein JWM11_4663 [Planctomycetaceae bacterium]|nr:hypothetical protein [Planctomycetaceae bacterium]
MGQRHPATDLIPMFHFPTSRGLNFLVIRGGTRFNLTPETVHNSKSVATGLYCLSGRTILEI